MIVAGFLFGLMGVFVKLGSAHFTSAELVFYRSVIGLAVIYAMVRLRGYSLRTQHLRMHLWRSLSGFIALLLFFYAISALPLATAITLNYTSPLFLALLLTLVLKQKPHAILFLAIIIGFGGVTLLLQPSFRSGQLFPGVMGLASGFLAGVAYLNVKQLGQIGEPDWRVVFYFTVVCSLGAGAWMLVHTFHPVSWASLPILIGLGSSATLAQLALTRAYRTGHTMVVASLAYTTVIFASLFGVVLWQEWLAPAAWLGIGLIILSGVISVLWTARSTPILNSTPLEDPPL